MNQPTTEFSSGQRVRLPGETTYVVIEDALARPEGAWRLYVADPTGLRPVDLTADQAASVDTLTIDGAADSADALAGLWAEWMRRAVVTSKATALASTPLSPFPHQNTAVYGTMLPQPLLRFLLADEPGTGKTIMGGLWLREAQRLGFVHRALIVAPAHLVTKWQADFDRFLGGDLRRITAETIRQGALSVPHDLWVVSLELAAVNPQVFEALHPDRAGWDAVVFDEAHRLTPTAEEQYRVGRMLATNTPRAVLMTATPHRGNEWLFRSLMHLVDPQVYPPVDRRAVTDRDQPATRLRPGPLHFLRRMKEELVDYDGATPLFKEREARNVPVALNADERAFYNEAVDLVETFFPDDAVTLARMVYGKRAASSLWSLAETLRRRRAQMGSEAPSEAARRADPNDDDEEAQEEARVIVANSKNLREERKAIDAILERLDTRLADPTAPISKWPRLIDDCLTPNGVTPGGDRQLVVFTEFADTADWLVDRFVAAGYTAKRYSGRDDHSVRDEIRAEFAAGGFQVIVSTDAGNEGIDLQTAQVLVNWDIPWSLVRLEQRMGRIHRVGQHDKVWLYNLIATDTREGDAHHRLLDNLVAAANELGGKMFDSLSLVAEIVLREAGVDDLEDLLTSAMRLPGDHTDPRITAVRSITKERIRQVYERQRQADDFLNSGVDINAALTSLHNERLERINPHIVERFLTRLAGARLIKVEQAAIAERGMWYLRPDALHLDGDLAPDAHGRALVATSGQAKRDAVNSGIAHAAGAVTLGPTEPAFRALADTVSTRLRPALFQGARLADPTAVTDYELHLYETDTSEGHGRRNATWTYLIRVDDVGARAISWEILANLEPADGTAGSPHPARVAHAETAAGVALDADQATHAAAMNDWLAGARNQLLGLPNDLTDDIDDAAERRAERRRLNDTITARITELEAALALDVGDLRRIGWVKVAGTAAATDPTEANSEHIAMVHVRNLLEAQGWGVADVHSLNVGYDLEARKGRHYRYVEVKGVWKAASSRGISLTGNEIAKAGLLAGDYWLYVVDQCHDGTGTLFAAWPNPAEVFADATRDVAVLRIPGSELTAAKDHSGDPT